MQKLIIILFFCLTPVLYSQINIEKYNNLNNSEGISGSLSFYASAKTGNTDVQEFGIDGRTNYNSEKFYTFLIGKGEYGWNKGKEYSNNALLHFRYIRKLNERINPEVFAQLNYNKSRQLLFRTLGGGGLRLSLISDSTSSLSFGSAYMYEYEKLDLEYNSIHPIKVYHHRWSNYFSYSTQLSNSSRLSIVVYAQPRFDDFKDIKILSENHLGVILTEQLTLSIIFALRYDSRAPDDVKDLDTNTKIGLSISL